MDLSKELFADAEGVRKSMSYFMGFGNLSAGGVNIHKIDVTSPNSIEIANAAVKIYPEENGFLLTLEQQLATYLIKVATDTFKYKLITYDKPQLPGTKIKSNSYVFDGKIFQIVANKDNMAMAVTDLESKTTIKKITLNKEEAISFKNTPIIQEGGVYAKYREMEKTTKFLRKISQGDLGISVHKVFDDFVITLGSTQEIATGGGFAPIGFGVTGGAVGGAFAVPFNPTFYAYDGYGNTKAVRIACLFDNDLNHLEGEISLNVFDIIDDYAEKLPRTEVETVFKLDNNHIWGYYSRNVNQYLLYEF